jgi:hypothetical protein
MPAHSEIRSSSIVRSLQPTLLALGLDRHFCLARSEHQIVDPVVQNDLLELGLVQCVQQGEGLIVFLSKHTDRFAVRGVRSL